MTLLLRSLVVLFLISQSLALAEAAHYHCNSTSGKFMRGSEYGNTRDSFLEALPKDVTNQGGFYYSQSITYTSTSDMMNCLGLCRVDLIALDKDSSCPNCIRNASTVIISNCPIEMDVIAWGEDAGCIVRCSPHDFPYTYEIEPVTHSCNASSVPLNYLPQFGQALANLTNSLAERAADDRSIHYFSFDQGDSPQYFATEESELGGLGLTIYALGLCLPTLSQRACSDCLRAATNISQRHCNGKRGATIFMPSCILRYELYRFYGSSLPLPSPSPSPFPPIWQHRLSSPSHVTLKEGRNSRTSASDVVLPMTTIIMLAVIALIITCIVHNTAKRRRQNGVDEDDAVGAESCLEFSLKTIRVATNDFSTQNKLGQGGFGAVYKGRLENGQQIAVKKLTVQSASREVEFKNEVQLVARLNHKNLIRLIGYCLQGRERILVYELAVNGSLDRLLFDPIRREHLSWKIRYNIIEGIARGMLYLHEESQLRIIHRDLKTSNILLDESMNPKISDFGTARLFVEEQGSASKIVGTYGYMSPEYVKHGKISVKVDVFSFGVLLLEIVCGKRNSAYGFQEPLEHLLSKAWNYWTTGNVLKLIDPILLRASGQKGEMTRCIHIGLLCVQEDATYRPTMNSVILMLEDISKRLPPPLKPAYFMRIEDHGPNTPTMDQNLSSDLYSGQQSSGVSSVNEVSITQPYPEPR